MKKQKLLSILLTAALATTAVSAGATVSVSASEYKVSTPQFSSIESENGKISLSWEPVKGADKYRVYYKGRNGWKRFAETSGTTAVDTDVKYGDTYTYTVRALNKYGDFVSDFNHSGWRHAYAENPKFSDIETVDGQINLSWKPVKGADKYRVYYKGRNGWKRFAETSGTTAVDTDVKYGDTYTYTVRALNKYGDFVSDFNHSGWRHAYAENPKFSDIETVDGQINLSWKPVKGADKYRVYYKGRNGWKRFAETSGTTAVDTDVKYGDTYTYTVRALDSSNNFISDFNHRGWQHAYAEIPQITSFENTIEGIKISWNKVDGAYKYRVYYKGRKGWTRFAETTGTTAVDKIVKSGETYTYTVRALDKNNNFVSDYNHSGWQFKRLEWHDTVYEYIEHPAETKDVKVIDKEADTYEKPIYETQGRCICKKCGADITDNLEHIFDCNSSYEVIPVKVQVGTEIVTVPEEYHYETIIIKEAWTETVIIKEAGWY